MPLPARRPGRLPSVWLVTAGLALGPLTGLGLGRFAYALLLPGMKADLHWTFAQAGLANAANALGYLAGSLVSARVARRFGSRRTFVAGVVLTAAALLASAPASAYALVLALRLVAGVGGAFAFIAGAGLLVQALAARQDVASRLPSALFFSGVSAGIAVSGLVVPALLAALPAGTGWRAGWLVMGAATAVLLVAAVLAARRAPEPPAPPADGDHRWPARSLAAALLSYGVYGAGYIAYMTFVVAFLRSEGASTVQVSLFWCVLGLAGIAGPFAWTRLLPRLRLGAGVALVLAVLAVGAALPLVGAHVAVTFTSAVLFGGSFLMVVTAFTDGTRRMLPSHLWTPVIGGMTAAFAAGQCAGPVLAGVLSDSAGGVRLGLGLSAGLIVVAAAVALAQRELRPAP